MTKSNILMTSSAKCHDCYRCVRVCPVKAIRIENGQAQIDNDKCILCGTCVRECPQHAKSYRNDINVVIELIEKGRVVASVAPSFAAIYGNDKSLRLPSALRQLGFSRVEETSIGAETVSNYVIEQMKNHKLDSGICSACPVVINYIEKYKPEEINLLMPVVSPMIAHGKMIKLLRPNTSVVFIGPCIAKKAEAQREEFKGIIDAVITFNELDEWLESKNISISNCAESGFDSTTVAPTAKLFPIPGGMLKTINMDDEQYIDKVLHTNGACNSMELIDAVNHCDNMEVLEPLFCQGGCINGIGVNCDKNLFERRNDLINYTLSKKDFIPNNDYKDVKVDLTTTYKPQEVNQIIPSEQAIEEIYLRTGKANPDRRLDCSACGYKTCRDNAIAIINGMAEPEMCLPYMRMLAERRSDRIMETSPNGMVILNDKLRIIAVNSSFKKYFGCSDAVCGRHINNIIDSKDYDKVLSDGGRLETMVFVQGREYHQIVYSLPEEKQLIGIYVDVAAVKITEAKIKHMRKQTAEQAQVLLQHQIEVAQQLTKFLGENTAKSEALLEKLLDNDD